MFKFLDTFTHLILARFFRTIKKMYKFIKSVLHTRKKYISLLQKGSVELTPGFAALNKVVITTAIGAATKTVLELVKCSCLCH